MTQYAEPFGIARLRASFEKLRTRVAKLETRTNGIDSGFPLMALPGVISGTYSSGDPEVYLNGAPTLTGPFQHLSSYTPAAGDNVLLIPVGVLQGYVVIGKLSG